MKPQAANSNSSENTSFALDFQLFKLAACDVLTVKISMILTFQAVALHRSIFNFDSLRYIICKYLMCKVDISKHLFHTITPSPH